jgi:hypothetical protein
VYVLVAVQTRTAGVTAVHPGEGKKDDPAGAVMVST